MVCFCHGCSGKTSHGVPRTGENSTESWCALEIPGTRQEFKAQNLGGGGGGGGGGSKHYLVKTLHQACMVLLNKYDAVICLHQTVMQLPGV